MADEHRLSHVIPVDALVYARELEAHAGSRENVYLLTYSFNQDFSCFVCGTTAGFRVFALEDNAKSSAISEKLRREHSPGFRHSSVMLISMLFKSANFAMVNQTLEPQGEPAPGCMNKADLACAGNSLLGAEGACGPDRWVCQVQIWDERKQKVVAELRCRNEVKGVCLHNSAPWHASAVFAPPSARNV